MTEIEKVIKGLIYCSQTKDGDTCPDWCPYSQTICVGSAGLMEDALALLKGQQPHLLKDEDELLAHEGAVWVEYITGYKAHWALVYQISASGCAILLSREGKLEWLDGAWRLSAYQWPMASYGKVWRCWSARPSDEQREAEAWQS